MEADWARNLAGSMNRYDFVSESTTPGWEASWGTKAKTATTRYSNHAIAAVRAVRAVRGRSCAVPAGLCGAVACASSATGLGTVLSSRGGGLRPGPGRSGPCPAR